MKTACVYNSIDVDGRMSAAIVRHWFEIELKKAFDYAITQSEEFQSNWKSGTIDFIGYNYGQPIPDLSKYDRVIMCDISFKLTTGTPIDRIKPMFDLKNRLGNNFIWIDHHISAINDVATYCDEYDYDLSFTPGRRDTKFSAWELTWKYFFPNKIMPEIVRLLGRYGCFGHKNTDEEQKVLEFQYDARNCINNYQTAYDYLLYNIEDVKNNKFNVIDDIQKQGKIIYEYLCTEAKQVYKNGFKLYLFEHQTTIPDNGSYDPIVRKFICINRERFNPINFGIDYHADGYDGAASFHYDGKAKIWRVSLYNDNDNVDCSVIAKQYGGGGHKGAAGFVMNQIQFNKLFNL